VRPGIFRLMNVAAVVVATLFLTSAAGAQTSAKPAVKPWSPSRLPDGQPDMQGMYTRSLRGSEADAPVSPIDPGDRNPLSVSNRGDGLGPYPKIFGQGPQTLRGAQQQPAQRRTGIVDPPDRKLPWRPEEDAKRRQFLLDQNPPKDLRHVELNARCVLPGLFVGQDGDNPFTFLQRPGSVVITYDYSHTSRVIDLNRREHIGKDVRLFMGDSIGHWEGNTLVADTTNFNFSSFSYEMPYLTDALHTIERFTIADQNTIDYEVTIDDAKLFTKPWTVAGFFSRAAKGAESIEMACAEGSQTLQNMFGPPPARP
jgi:hypothetical protein